MIRSVVEHLVSKSRSAKVHCGEVAHDRIHGEVFT